jgi:2-keto-4-pentenoate hydratase/2-oxohepta-3-ene-1,7-dioic acid hydratase in catechol pathway
MRIARFSYGEGVAFGVIEGELVVPIAGHPFAPIERTDIALQSADLRFIAPVLPSKVVAIGKNYASHAAEMDSEVPDRPLIFLKPSTAVIGPREAIASPPSSERVDFEGELAVVISRLCRDVTARDQQKADGQWSRAKGYDTFCPLGPWIETDLDPTDLAITTTLNGEKKQDSRTSMIVHKIPDLIAYITSCMTLLPGDVILTGTPDGIGPMRVGDEVSVEIEGIGSLTNPVVAR